MPINNKLLQDLLQVVYDKLTFVQPFPEGDFEQVLVRETERAAAWLESRIKTSLTPVRATNLPKSPEEAYMDKARFGDYIEAAFKSYPEWSHLTEGQKLLYGNDSRIYKPGSLPWQLMTQEQQLLFSSNVQYASNKVSDAERKDGKANAYIKLYHAPIVTVHSLALAFTAPPGYENKNLFFRLYRPNEFLVYHKEGAVHIFPAVMARIASTTQDPLYGSQYGSVAPRIPQVIMVDYEYGYTDATRPLSLMEAVALRTAMQIILYLSGLYTAGLQNFGVQGFSASFQNGLLFYPQFEQYKAELEDILKPFYRVSMTGW